jgi:hypothetical protein
MKKSARLFWLVMKCKVCGEDLQTSQELARAALRLAQFR